MLLINHCITLSSSFLTMFVHHAIFGLWVVLRTSKRKSKIFSRVLQFNEKEKLIDWNNLPFCHWHLLRFGISSYINVHLFSYIISLMWHSFCLCMITYPLSIILSWCATFWVACSKSYDRLYYDKWQFQKLQVLQLADWESQTDDKILNDI